VYTKLPASGKPLAAGGIASHIFDDMLWTSPGAFTDSKRSICPH
jgi:hypothetical protein